MKKILVGLFVIVGIIVVIIVGLALYGVSQSEKLIQSAVTTYGPKAIGAKVTLDKVKVSLSDGYAGLSGFIVGNPEGFKSAYAFKLDHMDVTIDTKSLMSDVVRAKEVRIDGANLILEIGAKDSNISKIQQNIDAYAKSFGITAAKSAKPVKSDSGTKFIVNNVNITNTRIKLASKYAPKASGVKIALDKIKVSLPDGHAGLSGFMVGNPEGFDSAYAFKLDRVDVTFDAKSLMSDVVHAKEVRIDGANLILEIGAKDSNIGKIQQNIDELTKSLGMTAAKSAKPVKSDSGAKFIVDNVSILNTRVKLASKYAPNAPGMKIALSKAKVSLLDGHARLSDLMVGNPEGFKSAYAFKLGHVNATFDAKSLTSDVIYIKEIRINGADLIYEVGTKGTNISKIQQNIDAYTKSLGMTAAKSDGETKYIIDDVYILNTKVKLAFRIFKGSGVRLGMPDIHLKNIGTKKKAATTWEINSRIFGAVNRSLGKIISKDMLGKNLKKARKTLGNTLKNMKKRFGHIFK